MKETFRDFKASSGVLKTHLNRLLLLLVFTLPAFTVFAQRTVTGTVVDPAGEPLIGVNIVIEGTSTGTITDIDGKYSLDITSNDDVLVFSYIGYLSKNVLVGEQTTINVTLTDDSRLMDELVVVGYGVQKKATVTGSIANVQGEDLQASATTNLTNAMVGRLPGVIGFQRADEPGGGGTTIRIRGQNTLGDNNPLIVIDGVPGRQGGLDRLNPNEIESLTVLKDASAAIYGSRAANGVIIVTTKKGKTGEPTLNYTGNYGFSTPTRLPEMANAFEYATLLNEINTNVGGNPVYTNEELQKFKDGSDPWGYPDTNWFDEAIKDVSPMYRHDLGLSGGTDRFTYYVNLAANGEDGIYYNSANRYDQYSVRVNLEAIINDYIKISYGNIGRMEYTQYPTKSAYSTFSALTRSKPTLPAYWPSGEPGPDIEYGDNPVVTGTDATGYDRQKRYYIQNTLQATFTLPNVEGLSLMTSGTYDKYFNVRKLFNKPWTLYSWDGNPEHELTPGLRGPGTPELTEQFTDQTFWMLNAVLNYNRTFNNHGIGITAGIEGEYRQEAYRSAFRKYFLSDKIDDMNAGGVKDMSNSGNTWEEARLNYFGRINYNYLERYLLEFVWRYDGSYKFPKDGRYGFFPGISAGWVISEEDFWEELRGSVSHMKLRASVGQTGNDRIESYQYLNTYGFGTDYLFGNGFAKTLQPIRTPNPNITWEVGTTYNVGLDVSFLRNRLTLETDAFYHKRTNMLIYRNASLPQTSGISLPRENLGEMENRGFESLITWRDQAGDFAYNISLNTTYAKNKILFWDETPGAPLWQQSTGKKAGTSLYYIADGVFKDQAAVDAYPHWTNARPGDIRFVDYNKDGVINADDRVRSDKNTEPDFIFGLTFGAEWKGFDLMVLFQGATGGETYIWRERAGEAGNFYKMTYENRWTPENPSSEHPRVYNRENEYWVSNRNTYYLYDTDYLRLKNIELGYTINAPFIKNAGITDMRIFANATNLFTWDKIKVQDPEGDATGQNYPQRKVMNVGVSLTF